jgi:hypothetical protein
MGGEQFSIGAIRWSQGAIGGCGSDAGRVRMEWNLTQVAGAGYKVRAQECVLNVLFYPALGPFW